MLTQTPEPILSATPVLDDRAPYEAAECVVRIIARLSPQRLDEQAVWQLIYDGVGQRERQYVDAIRRTRHSIFYHQMQQLYEFGLRHLKTVDRRGFCAAIGRDYTGRVIDESIYPLLQMAVAPQPGFQAAVIKMIRAHLGRHAGDKYVTTAELSPRAIRLGLTWGQPQEMAAYLRQYGLDPANCFANSFYFLVGAADRYASMVVAGYDSSAFNCELTGQSGWMSIPIGQDDRFAFDKLIGTLMGYVREVESGRLSAIQETDLEDSLVTRSPVMHQTWQRIRRASLSEEIVLLRGESGTGKSFIARRIHTLAHRRDKPFIEVGLVSDIGSDNLVQSNLFGHEKGAFTGATEQKQGLFSLADGGTIFLDEIGDASSEVQAKLLRVIESSTFKRLGGVRDLRVNVRIIAATNRDLERMVREGTFRQDLYYRLNVIPVLLPPLRHRSEDVPALAQYLLSHAVARAPGVHKTLGPQLAARLRSYPWPGNIRELEHAIKHALAMSDSDEISAGDFPPAIGAYLAGASTETESNGAIEPAVAPVINEPALRQAIRASDPIAMGSTDHAYRLPAHIMHARRVYLSALIDELHGDLALIGLFWDRTSEKTLRKLVRELGLSDQLAAARGRGKPD
jgi:DNA-binding NtrC family response regulator